MNIIDCPFPEPKYGTVTPHESTQTIWSVLFRNQTFKSRDPSHWLNGIIGVEPIPIKLPVIKEGYGISIDDIISCQPMVGNSKLILG